MVFQDYVDLYSSSPHAKLLGERGAPVEAPLARGKQESCRRWFQMEDETGRRQPRYKCDTNRLVLAILKPSSTLNSITGRKILTATLGLHSQVSTIAAMASQTTTIPVRETAPVSPSQQPIQGITNDTNAAISDDEKRGGTTEHANFAGKEDEETLPSSNAPIIALGIPNWQELEKQIVRRLDLTLMPMLWVLYLFNYLDRSSIA